MTDPRKLDAEAAAIAETPDELRERIGEYTKLFAAGLLAVVVIGGLIGLIGSSAVPVAIGYTAVVVGAIMALAGGANGGGYANLGFGLMDRMADAARRDGGHAPERPGRASRKYRVEPEEQTRRDPMDRLRRGLRPEKNPTAFWTVMGGFLYVAIGTALVLV